MPAAVFVDTNVLIYNRDVSVPAKQSRAHAWMEELWRRRAGRLSMQVLHEYYDAVTRKLTPGLDRPTARADVRDLMAWRPVRADLALTEGAWQLQDRFRLSWWDALIVSAARLARCPYVLSEDLQHDQDFSGVRMVNPFLVDPAGWPAWPAE